MRANSRHDGAFSSRDRVGWLIRSSPVSDKRPQASLNAGSKRKTSRSSQSSYLRSLDSSVSTYCSFQSGGGVSMSRNHYLKLIKQI